MLVDVISAVFGMLFGIGGPVAIVIIAIVISYKKKKRHYAAIEKALELGRKPEEVRQIFDIEKHERRTNGKAWLISGVVGAGLGFALLCIGFIVNEVGVYASSVFFLVMGLTFVLVYLFTKPRDKRSNDD